MFNALASVPNLRDLGGWPTSAGSVVRYGVLYRAAELHSLAPAGLDELAGLQLRTIYDLRTEAERAARPDPEPAGVTGVGLDVLADLALAAPAQLERLLDDPPAVTLRLAGDAGERIFSGVYRNIVGLPSAMAAYRGLFAGFAEQDAVPALFHCTTGKDRTGWAAAALLLLLGVSEADVRREYLQTNAMLLPTLQPFFDRFAAAGGDPAVLHPVLGVQDVYLDIALEEVRAGFGTIEGYFSDGLGLGSDLQQRLRELLLAPAPAPG